MTARILVVEDEPSIAELLRYNLVSSGYDVAVAGDGEEAMLKLEEEAFDLVILDWMLPHLSGIEICRRIRARAGTRTLPVIMLTARGEEDDRIRGLDVGADDYLTKPFSTPELLARIRAILRRSSPSLEEERLEAGDIVMDLAAHKVSRAGQDIHLGPTEFKLLRFFLERPGRVMSREQLLDGVWGRDVYVEERTVDVHIRRLRKALSQTGGEDPIRTVRSAGYAFESGASPAQG